MALVSGMQDAVIYKKRALIYTLLYITAFFMSVKRK